MVPSAKRARRDLLEQRHDDLIRCFRGQPPSILWNTDARVQLVWPSLRSLAELYFYIGRQQAQPLLAVILKLKHCNCLQIVGARGSGKSTVMGAISGYLHGTGTKRVVYVSGFHFVAAPFPVLHEALHLSWCGRVSEEQELWYIEDMAGLQAWCGWRGLYFVVDDWDMVEESPSAKDMLLACEGNILIKISSGKSREQVAYDASDKSGDYVRTFHFDGPYTASELDTWIAHSGLSAGRLASLDYYTGGMPRLARYFSECPDAEAYTKEVAMMSRVQEEIVSHLKKRDQLVAALKLVTSHGGMSLPLVLEGMKLAWFYKEGYEYHILCPYLRKLAEDAIVSEGSMEKALFPGDVQTWISAVQADLRAPRAARNPARIGWNVEGLVIGVLRVQSQLLPNYPFAVYRTYARGKEIDALDGLDDVDLRRGVLLGPEALSEKAADVVYLILRDAVLELVVLQITVSQWKAREKKSHVTWKDEVLPRWTPRADYRVQQTFLYAMPQNVSLEDVEAVKCKAFTEFSARLGFLDALDLEEPQSVRKTASKKCRGGKYVTHCGNSSKCTTCQQFCTCNWYCHLHVDQASASARTT